jgi:hypothetical protein
LDLIETTDPATNGAGCYIVTDDVGVARPTHPRLGFQ